MKVLHILDHSLPVHSGYSFRSAEILAAQKDMGLSVAAITSPKHQQFLGQDDAGGHVDYKRTSFPNLFMSRVPIVVQGEVVRALYKGIELILQKENIDIIHAHSPALNGIAALRAARKYSLPIVYEMRASWEDAAVDHGVTRTGSVRYRLTRALESYILNRVDAVTTICSGLRNEIVSRGVDESKITIIPNAVDIQKFTSRQENRKGLRVEYGVQGKFVMAFCGSFYSYEGLDMLIDVLQKLKDSIPEAALILAGGGEEDARLRTMADEFGVSDKVTFLGRVTQDAVIDIYNLADVCVFPRRRMKLTETVTPLKPLEAMAAGAIVLASDVGGHKELIEDAVTGLLYEAESIDSLAEALKRVANSKSLNHLSSRARSFVCSERTWKSSVEKYRKVYEQAVSSRNRG